MPKHLVLLVSGVLLTGGCYTYRPLRSPDPLPGMRVAGELTDDGARQMAATVGPDVVHVEGEVVSADSVTLALSLAQVGNREGVPTGWRGEQVKFRRDYLYGLQQRRLSVGGTGLLGGVTAVGLYAIYRLLGGSAIFEGGGNTGHPGPQ